MPFCKRRNGIQKVLTTNPAQGFLLSSPLSPSTHNQKFQSFYTAIGYTDCDRLSTLRVAREPAGLPYLAKGDTLPKSLLIVA